MNEVGKYIYGIIESDKELFFASCKVIAGSDVYTIPYQDISAVVSEAERVDYDNLLKDTVARHLVRHQLVIEKVMESFTIIPVRVGTYALNQDEVRHILIHGYPIIKDIFEKIEGKIEMDVVATRSHFETLLKEVAEEEDIKEFKQVLQTRKEGVTVNDQMKIGFLIKKHLDERRERYASEIETSLNRISQNRRAHACMDDNMILNTAFLIKKSDLKYFENIVEELNKRFAENLNFKCVGPLPPYSFHTLEVKRIQFTDVALAKGQLNLTDAANKKEIEKAYRRLALVYHPDKNSDRPDAQGQFDRITKAYKLLLEYYNSGIGPFRERGPSDALIVKVRD